VTVLAWDGRTLAADTAVSDGEGGTKTRFSRKLRRTGDGRLIGGAGDVGPMIELMDWLESGTDDVLPKIKGSAECIVVMPDRTVAVYETSGIPIDVDEPVAAIGSGADLALGALLAGASAVRACEIAIERDPHCGFDVAFLTL
jgi:ATP-dependent protease HslVU (ClpYQ) peptidase subunit